jgi:ribose transport system permease protein
MTSAAAAVGGARRGLSFGRLARRHSWTVGVYVLLLVLVLYWRTIPAKWGSFDVQSLAIDALPLAFAAMAQSIVIVSGGIDLSVGSLISLVNVVSAKYMVDMSFTRALLFAALLLVGSSAAGAFTGSLIVLSRVPDIVVTLAMLFVWAGVALQILQIPGGGAPLPYLQLAVGHWWSQWIPSGLVILLLAFALFWLPLRWARPGLALYSVGSNRSAAYLSGVGVARTRVFAYALGGLFAGLAGLALTATSGIGDPNAGQYYTLNSVAAAVLGGVSLVGGVGGLIGPIAAAFVVTLVKTMLILKGVDQNWAQVIQGSLIIVVVLIGGLAIRQRRRRA